MDSTRRKLSIYTRVYLPLPDLMGVQKVSLCGDVFSLALRGRIVFYFEALSAIDSGSPSAAWKMLHERFTPVSSVHLELCQNEFNSARIIPGTDPLLFLDELMLLVAVRNNNGNKGKGSRKGKDGRKQGKGGKRERRCFRCGERTHLMADCKAQVKPAADQVEQPPRLVSRLASL